MVYYADIRAGAGEISLNANFIRLLLEEQSDNPELDITEEYLRTVCIELESEIWLLLAHGKPVDLLEILANLVVDSAPDDEER